MPPSAKTAGGRRVRRWTRELIIEKILEWEARYGEPPCSADWNPSLARWRAQEWRAERYREGVWPSTNAAKRPFDGSFDAAVRAAGLEPHKPGPRRRAAGAARPESSSARRVTAPKAKQSPARRGADRSVGAPCWWPRAGPTVPRRRRARRAACASPDRSARAPRAREGRVAATSVPRRWSASRS